MERSRSIDAEFMDVQFRGGFLIVLTLNVYITIFKPLLLKWGGGGGMKNPLVEVTE